MLCTISSEIFYAGKLLIRFIDPTEFSIKGVARLLDIIILSTSRARREDHARKASQRCQERREEGWRKGQDGHH